MKPDRIAALLGRAVLIVAGALAATFLAVVATCIGRGGLEGGVAAAGRLLRHGPTTVWNFRL